MKRAACGWATACGISYSGGGKSSAAVGGRYVGGTFVGEHGAITVAEWLDQVIEETAEHAEALGCFSEMKRCRAIVGGGTSADAQMAVYERHRQTEDRIKALQAVSDWIAVATLQ